MSNLGFDKKLLIGSTLIIILTIGIVTTFNFYQTKNAFLTRGQNGIETVSDVLKKALQLKYNLQKEKIQADIGALIAESQSVGTIKVVPNRKIDFEIFDGHRPGRHEKQTLPSIYFGYNYATKDFTTVDKIGQFSTSDIAVYQFHEDKLIKVSSNKSDDKGNRIIGEYISAGNPVFEKIKKESPVSLLTMTGPDIAIQQLHPLLDTLEGEVIGAYSVTSRIFTPDLVELVRKINVHGHGFCFISNEQGSILAHPDERYLALKVSDLLGGQAMADKKSRAISYEFENKTFHAFIHYYKPWNLYFTVVVSEDELMTGVNRQMIFVAAVSGALALLIALLMITIMNRQLMKSMRGMATLAQEVANGNFNHAFTYTANDAIKVTVDSMNLMVRELAHLIREINEGIDTLSRPPLTVFHHRPIFWL